MNSACNAERAWVKPELPLRKKEKKSQEKRMRMKLKTTEAKEKRGENHGW